MLRLCSLNSMILHLYSLKYNSILSMDMNNKIRKNKGNQSYFSSVKTCSDPISINEGPTQKKWSSYVFKCNIN